MTKKICAFMLCSDWDKVEAVTVALAKSCCSQLKAVGTTEALIGALAKGPVDIIFLDYNDQTVTLLNMLQQTKGQTPVVILAGRIGEEAVAAVFVAGANGFLLYENLNMLGQVVEGILAYAQVVARDKEGRPVQMAGSHLEITQQKELEATLRRYELIFNYAHVGLVIGSADGTTLETMNRYFAAMHGYTVEELTGRPIVDVFAPECRAGIPAITERAHQQGFITYESKHIKKDGTVFPVLVSSNAIYHDNKAQYRIVNVVDLTEIKKMGEQMRRLCDRTNALIRTSAAINAKLDLKDVLQTICEETARLFKDLGVTIHLKKENVEELVWAGGYGMEKDDYLESIPLKYLEQYFPEPEQVLVIPDLRNLEDFPYKEVVQLYNISTLACAKVLAKNNLIGVLFCFGFGVPRPFSEGERLMLQGIADQAALAIQNAGLYEEVRASREKLRQLNSRLITAQEEERRRLSRELHDEAGQALTGLKITLELISGTIACKECKQKEWLAKAVALTDETMEKVRYLAHDLRPPELDEAGLSVALEGYCRNFSDRTDLTINYFGCEPANLPDPVSICLYRILQEALTNVAKHAKASNVEVLLQTDAEYIVLVIQDNGVGFSCENRQLSGSGVGLLGMKERLGLLHGELELTTRVGEGVRLTARIPWEVTP